MPDAPVKVVKNAQVKSTTTAIPPGNQPTLARANATKRSGAFPSATIYPAKVKSGIMSIVEFRVRRLKSIRIVEIGSPAVAYPIIEAPPSNTKRAPPKSANPTNPMPIINPINLILLRQCLVSVHHLLSGCQFGGRDGCR